MEWSELERLEALRKSVVARMAKLDKQATPEAMVWCPIEGHTLADAHDARISCGPDLKTDVLAKVLGSYGLAGAMVKGTHVGPTVTTYLVEIPEGARVQSLASRTADLCRDLGQAGLRVLDQVVGHRGCIGFEVPNESRGDVAFKDTLMALQARGTKASLPLIIGSSSLGRPMSLDLSSMPHLLVAGTTGSGKSQFLHSAICSLLCLRSPKDVGLQLVDPKKLEFSCYKVLEHVKSYSTSQEATLVVLDQMITLMNIRNDYLAKAGASNIQELRAKAEESNTQLTPGISRYQVVIIDEFAQLMLSGPRGKEIKDKVVSIAAVGRAAGIHLIIATQKPTVDVLDKQIKGCLPSRVAFRVADPSDSRVILDEGGAEALLGSGDMLMKMEQGGVCRLQGAFLDKRVRDTIISRSPKRG